MGDILEITERSTTMTHGMRKRLLTLVVGSVAYWNAPVGDGIDAVLAEEQPGPAGVPRSVSCSGVTDPLRSFALVAPSTVSLGEFARLIAASLCRKIVLPDHLVERRVSLILRSTVTIGDVEHLLDAVVKSAGLVRTRVPGGWEVSEGTSGAHQMSKMGVVASRLPAPVAASLMPVLRRLISSQGSILETRTRYWKEGLVQKERFLVVLDDADRLSRVVQLLDWLDPANAPAAARNAPSTNGTP